MTPEEARARLGLGASEVGAEQVRRAYLQRVAATTLDADLDGFLSLRRAFEIASPARATGAAVQAAREALVASPRSPEARWELLSLLPYAFDSEASTAVLEGARLDPEGFLDELLLHFPAVAPPDLMAMAAVGNCATFGRRMLLARVHAEQGQPAAALETMAAALNAAGDCPRHLTLRLALGVVFALQATARNDDAAAALRLIALTANLGPASSSPSTHPTEIALAMANELDRLKDALPLELRQAAARAAQRDDLANLPYAARFAVRNVNATVLRQLRRRLRSEAPTLSQVLALDVPEDQLRPKGTPSFRYAIGVGAFIPLVVLLMFAYKRFTTPAVDVDKMLGEVNHELVQQSLDKACADPNSDFCRFLAAQGADGGRDDGSDGGASPDAGIDADDGGAVRRSAVVRRRPHPR